MLGFWLLVFPLLTTCKQGSSNIYIDMAKVPDVCCYRPPESSA